MITSCSDDLSDINTDSKNPTEVPHETLVTSATKSLVDQMVNTNVNTNIYRLLAQYWTETTYTDEANFNLINRSIPQSHWNIMYADVLKDLDRAAELMDQREQELLVEIPQEQIDNQRAIIEILKVYTYHVLVDTFGDIPYTEALDIDNTTPAYDDDLAIYNDIIERLNAAIGQLNTGFNGFRNGSDLIYDGNTGDWMKFANSLKLRLALRLGGVDDTKGATMATEAINAGVFSSNDDNATMQYLQSSPNTNPLWEDLVQSGRTDFVAANTIVDAMNQREDPRRDDFFAPNQDDPDTEEIEYEGGPYAASGNQHSNSTIYSEKFENPVLEGVLLDYSEVQFLMAEAVERGYITGDAEEFYNSAIEASIVYWGGTSDEADDYIDEDNVNYSTSGDSWQEKIGIQKWISLYNRGFEGWSTYRKLGYPELPNAAVSDLPVPNRFTYPVIEASANGVNYTAAGEAIGGNTQQTKIFWDVD
ncbi:SusD/RagB family nutrient-binding outer membrane lipoprotein [Zunongwangia endophytica]|uniref:SusD/RagB family nutrient-binding outer membrane lipoprotein n=1 Tax=Zunongwangia endophytica TaxID=1808945 RepID=A0ABV8H1Z7_9FLAO|nr:SusD/RagB family nutrient-binding outer membrane lipoprotein [Zunongwangia endophytica]MDN3596420.1 SusD/RagB family nutrient-binding outer membrane lipoprotein [Zunongwangia endophytica]